VRLSVVRNTADTLPLVNPILFQSETSVVQGFITIQQPGLTLICHRKITLWRIVGTKWVVNRDAIAGRRTDRTSKNRIELPPPKKVIDLTQVEVFTNADKNRINTS